MLHFPKNPYTLAGFERGSSVRVADAMSTAHGDQMTWRKNRPKFSQIHFVEFNA
jgi:hypothetical protein